MVEGIFIVALGALACLSLCAARRNQADAERYRGLKALGLREVRHLFTGEPMFVQRFETVFKNIPDSIPPQSHLDEAVDAANERINKEARWI